MKVQETIKYDHSYVQVFDKVLKHYTFQQYVLKKGLEVLRERGREAAFKEMEQLHLRNCFRPLDMKELTMEAKNKALGSLIFLKEKNRRSER